MRRQFDYGVKNSEGCSQKRKSDEDCPVKSKKVQNEDKENSICAKIEDLRRRIVYQHYALEYSNVRIANNMNIDASIVSRVLSV
uniref:Uncharacterized protein n=1 Tax=Amphimedon queenslandica TaxID=400682 RepID=A0A1X7TTH0_AMPQE